MTRRMAIVAAALVVTVGTAAAGAKVAVPTDVGWAEIRPYLEANLRVDVEQGVMTVAVSSEGRERALFEPFDPFLGELATVLLAEVLSDKKSGPILVDLVGELEGGLAGQDWPDRDELTALYWERVETDGRVLDRAEVIFERARKKGRLRCFICDDGFAPTHLSLR